MLAREPELGLVLVRVGLVYVPVYAFVLVVSEGGRRL